MALTSLNLTRAVRYQHRVVRWRVLKVNKRILLGVDANIAPATQHALRTVGEFLEESSSRLHVVLLNVIPLPYTVSPSLGMSVGSLQSLSVSLEQRTLAENVLRKAKKELQKRGIASERIEVLIRVGVPADEIVRAARELQVDFIVIGSRGDAFGQKVRRFLAGSTSRRVLQLAPCPVMIVVVPPAPRPGNLVAWYEEAISHHLQEHTGALSVFTSREVAQMFLPPQKKTAGRKEIAAATLALEQLARNGVLFRHEVKGELRYVND